MQRDWQVGDVVFVRSRGDFTVLAEEKTVLMGREMVWFSLRSTSGTDTLRVPKASVQTLASLISPEQAAALLVALEEPGCGFHGPWTRRLDWYRAVLKAADPSDLVKLLRDMVERENESTDSAHYREAQRCLAIEIGSALDIDFTEAETRIGLALSR